MVSPDSAYDTGRNASCVAPNIVGTDRHVDGVVLLHDLLGCIVVGKVTHILYLNIHDLPRLEQSRHRLGDGAGQSQ